MSGHRSQSKEPNWPFDPYLDGHGMSIGLEDQKPQHRSPPAPLLGLFLEFVMEKFVERQKITRFTTLLMTETDKAKRELLQTLLIDEMVRLASDGDGRKKFW